MENSQDLECGAQPCVCEGGPTLSVLKEVQKAYEERMALVNRIGGAGKLQKQVEVLQCWVSDLVSQNTLLIRTVEELETEVTSRLLLERRRHSERDKNKKPCGKLSEMKILNESLKTENVTKDRELRRLNKDIQQYEQTILSLRKELTNSKYHTPDVSKKDAEVMADICCSGTFECRDAEPVREYGALVRKDSQLYQEPLHQMEISIKPSNENVRSLRQVNVALKEEVHAMQRVCAALDEQCHVAALRAQFKDEIIHEMRQQLRKAKAKLEMVTSTPNLSDEKMPMNVSEVSIVEQTPSPPLLLTDSSMNETYPGCTPCAVSQHPTKCETQNVNTTEREGKTVETDKKKSDKEAESDHNNHSILILIEAMECDCDEENLADKEMRSATTMPCSCERSKENIIVKENSFAKFESKPNKAESIASQKSTVREHNNGTDSKKRHVSLAQITEKRRRDNDGNSYTKSGIRRDSTIDKTHKKLKRSNDTATRLNESVGAHSVASSAGEAARAQSLEDKLLATMQILKNKEETVRVQAESLSLAEARIAALTAKAQHTTQKLHQAQQTPLYTTRSASAGCHVEMTDASSTADLQDTDHQIVNTLRDNLSVIEELYRECFYESAQQEELITMLRRSYLDMRRMERQRSQQIGRLQRVVHSQRCSLERCQVTKCIPQSAQQEDLITMLRRSYLDMRRMERQRSQQIGRLQRVVHSQRCSLERCQVTKCIPQSAQQEELITMLRRSYLDMRRMERQRSQQIGRLQRVVHSQRCSLERCQDIAVEVENLKSEITNFLNSAQNNDSGVWEREEYAGDVTEDLRGIAEQLRRLRDMLNTDCTCGLEEENLKLKRINKTMEIQIRDLRQRVDDLEEALQNKENMDQQHHARIQEKEQELQNVRRQLVALEEGSREQDNTCDALNCKLQQMEVLLKDKSSELVSVKQQCEAQEATIRELREELNKADLMAQESGQVREEVSCLSSQVAQWREQLAATRRRLRALEAELQRARDHCRHLAVHYRDKAQLAEGLQAQLEEAQTRGAELCVETRRAVCGVRHWLRRQRQRNREQEEIIKQQEILIQTLQQQGSSKPTEHASTSDNEPCCSKYLTRVEARRSDHSFVSANETGCSKCASSKVTVRTSESEIASSPAPPTPPRRLLRKKPFCGDIRCQWPTTRDASAQRPVRSDASVNARLSHDQLSSYTATPTREMSPTDELLERVERAHEALADAHKRWTRGAGGRDVDR